MKVDVWYMILVLWVIIVFNYINNAGASLGIVIAITLIYIVEKIIEFANTGKGEVKK